MINLLDQLETSQGFPILELFTFKDSVTLVGQECTPEDFRPLIDAISADGVLLPEGSA